MAPAPSSTAWRARDSCSGCSTTRRTAAKVRRSGRGSPPLTAERFGIEVELTARLAQAGARIWELPISYSGRTYAEGKKITWRDGMAAMFHILRYNLLPPRGKWRER